VSDNDLPQINRRVRVVTLATPVVILWVLFIEAVSQATLGGSACPAWLLCQSQARSPQATVFWLDGARYLSAGLAVLLSLTATGLTWPRRRQHRLPAGLSLGTSLAATLQLLLLLSRLTGGDQPLLWLAALALNLLFLALSVALATVVFLPEGGLVWAKLAPHRFYGRLLAGAGLALLVITLNGLLISGTGAGAACPDWPLCRGQLLPLTAFEPGLVINLLHRLAVVGAGIIIAAIVLQTYQRYAGQPYLVRWASMLGLLFLIQVGVGGWTVFLPLSRLWVSAIHLVLTATLWANLVVLAVIFLLSAASLPLEAGPASRPPYLPFRQKAGIYFKLTKPWIMVLLLITTVGAMVIAAKGIPSLALLIFTTLGGAFAAGGASVLNSYVDSDIDHLMARTSRRATVTGLVTPQETLIFGLILSTLSFFVFALLVNTLSAVLSTVGILYYVFFYTLYLKRNTIHNIIIGGAAGAIPPLVGWTAVTGLLDLGAFYLFAIIFFWTPPHTWALALLVKKDYAQARVPMLPVVVGEKETTYQIFLYSILLVTLTLLPFTFSMLSLVYLVAALILGIPFIYLAWKLWRNFGKSDSKRLYKFSQLYLALLFILMAVDRSLFV
jgi:protoheme IX farnesyltransferase